MTLSTLIALALAFCAGALFQKWRDNPTYDLEMEHIGDGKYDVYFEGKYIGQMTKAEAFEYAKKQVENEDENT